jgi:ketosteroid isomerase-like protein
MIVLLLLLCFPIAPAWADDREDLKNSFEEILERLNAKDLKGFLSGWHPDAVLMVYDYVFPVDRADAGEEIWSQIFDDFLVSTESIRLIPVDVDFRVVEDTGIVWGTAQNVTELKNGTRRVVNLRLSATFVKAGGRWLLLSWQSAIPPERNPRPGVQGE